MERNKLLVSNHLFLIKNQEILLYKRRGGSQDGYYNVIAGHLDGGETATQSIIREAKEEAGILIDKRDVKFVSVSHSFAGGKEYIQFFMYCDKWSGEIQNLEPERCYSMEFFPINKLPANTTPYIKKAIQCYLDGVNYYEYTEE